MPGAIVSWNRHPLSYITIHITLGVELEHLPVCNSLADPIIRICLITHGAESQIAPRNHHIHRAESDRAYVFPLLWRIWCFTQSVYTHVVCTQHIQCVKDSDSRFVVVQISHLLINDLHKADFVLGGKSC